VLRPGLHHSWVQELTAGILRGHYRIVRRLGQGMGVVYEAEDQKLGRSVAIKLLPETTRQDLQLRKCSDVVLIKDLNGSQPH
jgi:serine/threonine protein kinase